MHRRDIDGFSRIDDVEHAGIQLPVFVSDKGSKPLVVLHELPGMTPAFIRYCKAMVAHDYKVYMPLIFGEPNSQMGFVQMAAFCLSREFRHLFKMSNPSADGRPFPRWLLHLTDFVIEQNSNRDIGVVGMCLTGGFAIAAIANKSVGAAVTCQPAFPFFFGIHTLGLTSQQRKACSQRCKVADEVLVKGYRYQKDWICRGSHMRAVKDLLENGFERHPDLHGFGHSTVTDADPEKNKIVFDDILEFLARRLG